MKLSRTYSSPDLDPTTAWLPFEPTTESPWTNRLAAHLFRRVGFGATVEQITQSVSDGLSNSMNGLFNFAAAEKFDSEMETAGRLVTPGTDAKGLAAWWLLRMAKTPCPLIEKMTLFWHGHFATGADKVNDARAMLRQNILLRQKCLKQFQPLVAALSRDVAMLIYLDSTENRKTHPNENYARELLELFCLGPGNYSETDIKEIARCFTGWEVRRKQFKFNRYQHDTGNKKFLGVNGNIDGDIAIETILRRPAAARFIAKKLIRFFVFDDEPITDELAEPIAIELRESNYQIEPVMRRIFSSRIFFSDASVGQKIKSPIELAIGALRFFDASINLQQLGNKLAALGQLPLFPPNVKGWEGGRSWINAATILARANLLEQMLTSNETKFAAGGLSQWLEQHESVGWRDSADWLEDFWLAAPLSAEAKNVFHDQIKNDPARAFAVLAALPEFQIN